MSLIFDGFKTRCQAERFAAATEKRFNLHAYIPEDRADSMKHDPFPFELGEHIVHIDRPPFGLEGSQRIEFRIIASVTRFGGAWAGT